jgi:hypothetical protein
MGTEPEGKIILPNSMNISLRRRALCGAGLSLVVSACEAKPMRVFLNISLFSYLDRPIFDVKMNGTDFMDAAEHSFYGSNAVMVMQPITLGLQTVTWKLDGPEGAPRNGELVTAKVRPMLSEVPRDVKWLALHIYDDETVEIKLSKGARDELKTERGQKIIEAWESRDGR